MESSLLSFTFFTMLVVGVAAGLVLAGAVRVIFGADMENFLNLGKNLGKCQVNSLN